MPRLLGYVVTATTNETVLGKTTYTEQSSNAQRSFASSSAADTAAGTGARSVLLEYFSLDASGNVGGPYTEIVTLNGTTPVATVGTNICYIQSMRLKTAGSGSVAAGTISLFVNNAGGGGVIASIAAGDLREYFGHRYVGSGRHEYLMDALVTNNGTSQVNLAIRQTDLSIAGAAETVISNSLAVKGGYGSTFIQFTEQTVPPIVGPARIRAYATCGDTGSQVTRADIAFSEA